MLYREGIIEDLDAELSPDAALLPDIVTVPTILQCVAVANIEYVKQGELLQEISELQKDIKGIKLAQDAQVRAIRDEVKDETKTQIVQLMGYVVSHYTRMFRRHIHGISDTWYADTKLNLSLQTLSRPR